MAWRRPRPHPREPVCVGGGGGRSCSWGERRNAQPGYGGHHPVSQEGCGRSRAPPGFACPPLCVVRGPDCKTALAAAPDGKGACLTTGVQGMMVDRQPQANAHLARPEPVPRGLALHPTPVLVGETSRRVRLVRAAFSQQ